MNYPAMLFGAFSSAILATLATAVLLRPTRRQPLLLLTAALSAFTGPLTWKSILRATGATGAFSHDIPFRPFPISWQYTGSGVFALAVPSGQPPARRSARHRRHFRAVRGPLAHC